MGNSILRKYIRESLTSIVSGAQVYTVGPNKFPYMDGTDAKTPSDLASEAEEENNDESEEDDLD